MKKSDWLIAIIKGAKGKSRENGERDFIVFDGKGFFDSKGVPLQINIHNTNLEIVEETK